MRTYAEAQFSGNGKRTEPSLFETPRKPGDFPESIPASALKRCDPDASSLLSGYLFEDGITLLSAIPKAGKTRI